MSAEAAGQDRIASVIEAIMHHVQDSHEWHTPFFNLHLPSLISLHGVMLVICTALLIFLFGVVYKKGRLVPRGASNLLEVFVLFVRDEISVANLGKEDGHKMAPFFCSLFFFILGLNIMGLIPLFAAATGNINVTAALALTTVGAIFITGIARHGFIGFLHIFVPPGVPLPILCLLAPLEFMGIFIKAFALMIRLFANMFAGHVVLFATIGLAVMFGAYASPPAVMMATGIYLLEVFVALLQAYVFTLLSAIFIGQVLHPEH